MVIAMMITIVTTTSTPLMMVRTVATIIVLNAHDDHRQRLSRFSRRQERMHQKTRTYRHVLGQHDVDVNQKAVAEVEGPDRVDVTYVDVMVHGHPSHFGKKHGVGCVARQ
jgi:hypothetical protein